MDRDEIEGLGDPLIYLGAGFAVADHDWVRPDQAVAYINSIPGAGLFVVPDAGHFVRDAEPEKLLPVVERFLRRTEAKLPFATTVIAYQWGMSR